MQVTVGLFRKD